MKNNDIARQGFLDSDVPPDGKNYECVRGASALSLLGAHLG